MASSIKSQFTILLLLLAVVYAYRSQLYLATMYAYSITNSPHAERLIGEHYSMQSKKLAHKAAIHLQKALYGYKIALPLSSEEQKKWIAYLIGTHYECGRGVNADIETARKWYQHSADSGAIPAKQLLTQINDFLKQVEKEKAKGSR